MKPIGGFAGLRLFSALAIWGIAIWGLFGFDPSSIPLGYWMKCLAVSFFVSACLLLASAKWRERRGEDPWPADRWSLVMIVLAAVFMNPFPRPEPGDLDAKDWSVSISAMAPFVMMHLSNSWPVRKSNAKGLLLTAQFVTGCMLIWPLAVVSMMGYGIHAPALKTSSAALLFLPVTIMAVRRPLALVREKRMATFVVAMLSSSIAVMIVYSFIKPGPLLAPILVYLPLHAVALGMAACYGRP